MNFDRLDEFMKSLDKDYGVTGAAVAVLYDGKEVFRTYSGKRNETGDSVDDNTLYRWYSMTKPVTAVAALQLLEQGRYELQEPVGKYLPSFNGMTVVKINGNGSYGWWNPPAKNALTIRHLFTMTAGLTYGGMYHPAEIFTSKAIDKLAADTNNSYTTRQLADALGNSPLMFEPGEHWNYSFCMDVLGALVEVWSGMSFGEYLKKNMFEPLEMKDVCFFANDEQKNRMMDFCEYNGTEKVKTYTETDRPLYTGKCFESGGAGLIGSLDDYLKFAYALCNGGVGKNGNRIISDYSISLMRTNCLNEKQLKDYDWEALGGYGYGLGVRTMMDRTITGSLSSIGEFGWNGMAGTYLLVDPDEKIAIVYMQQRYPSMETEIQPRLRNIVYSCLKKD